MVEIYRRKINRLKKGTRKISIPCKKLKNQ